MSRYRETTAGNRLSNDDSAKSKKPRVRNDGIQPAGRDERGKRPGRPNHVAACSWRQHCLFLNRNAFPAGEAVFDRRKGGLMAD
jgi:hypothetical protein